MKKLLLLIGILACGAAQAQGAWTAKANFPGTARSGMAGFVIGAKAYVGTGILDTGQTSSSPVYQDFWEFDPATNTWTQKANFPGAARGFASGFAVNGKGYLGLGYDGSMAGFQDWWEYDPVGNSWVQKANYPPGWRGAAAEFAIAGKGYIATGRDITSSYQDVWEYDPVANSWTQKANFPAIARQNPVSFSIGTKGYVATGSDINNNFFADLWEFDPVANSWTQRANFPGAARGEANGFSIGAKGYVGSGTLGMSSAFDWWVWDQGTNTWTQQTMFPGQASEGSFGFSVGTKGYAVSGKGQLSVETWEFDPAGTSVNEISPEVSVCFYPNPVADYAIISLQAFSPSTNMQLSVYDLAGKRLKAIPVSSNTLQLDCSDLSSGVYLYEISATDKILHAGKFLKK